MVEERRLRECQLRVWLLEEEKELLKQMAFEYGLSMSDCVRKLIVAQRLSERQWTMDREIGMALVREINAIGNNVNQIAYNTNAKTFTAYSDFMALKETNIQLLSCIGKLPFLTEEEKREWHTLTYTLSCKLLGSQSDK